MRMEHGGWRWEIGDGRLEMEIVIQVGRWEMEMKGGEILSYSVGSVNLRGGLLIYWMQGSDAPKTLSVGVGGSRTSILAPKERERESLMFKLRRTAGYDIVDQ